MVTFPAFLIVAFSITLAGSVASAAELTVAAVNDATISGRGELRGPALLKLQVLLDRARVSPGQIDGRNGENTRKAIKAYQRLSGSEVNGRSRRAVFQKLGADAEPVLVPYRISNDDVAGPFIDRVPEDYREKAELGRLGFTGPLELLAEKFHMSEDLLQKLNPDASFDQAGTEIIVANVRQGRLGGQVSRLEVSAREQTVTAYARDDIILAIYPATVGSRERPSPSGEFKVTGIATDPVYYYDPKNQLRGVDVEEKLKLPPGPNNPVGSVWIDLSSEGYGIHGTPDPDKVSKTASHGCIRLTNWDANELARSVKKGMPVAIVEAGSRRQAGSR
jgi:lipoprotein-anchoring transpeptidase ErfK/SrfK